MKKYFAGIDLGGTKILTVIADSERNVLSKVKVLSESIKGVDHVIGNMFRSVSEGCEKAGITSSALSGIGIGVPGPVNHKTGMVYDCPNLMNWKNIEVGRIFSEKFKTEIVVENDARVAGLAEVRFGAARGYRYVFYVTVSTGIGGAIIIDGRIYHGADGAAGEFGQFILLDGSIMESRYAGPAVEKLFGIKTEQIPALLEVNDQGARKALNHIIHGLGIYLSNITTLLNPEIIVIGGGVSSLGSKFIDPIQEMVRNNAFSISSKNIKVVSAGLGTDSGAIGAVELLFNAEI